MNSVMEKVYPTILSKRIASGLALKHFFLKEKAEIAY